MTDISLVIPNKKKIEIKKIHNKRVNVYTHKQDFKNSNIKI